MKIRNSLLLMSSFINGAIIMILEILAVKKFEPFFGNSFVLWSSVIAFTMLGLVFGYLIGGKFGSRNKKQILYLSNLMTALFLLAIIYFSDLFINLLHISSYNLSVFLTSLILITPLFITLGTISPILAQLYETKENSSGEKAGLVFSLSSLGGIIAILFFGFYFIPQAGVNISFKSCLILLFFESFCVFFVKEYSK